MPAWNLFKKRYAMEIDDLTSSAGFNVVVIEKLDSEEYVDRKNVAQVRHQIYFAGYEYPLRLNNTRIDVLRAMFGPQSENAVGKKVALLIAAGSSYGATEATINIYPHAPPPDAAITPVKSEVACRSSLRRKNAEMYGVPFLPPPAALPAGQTQPWTQHGAAGSAPQLTGAAATATAGAVGVASASGSTLGKESAAKLILLLRERKREWDFVVSHLRGIGMGAMVEGKSPPDCDAGIRQLVWKVIKDLPVTVAIENRAEAEADLVAAWTPPEPGTTTVLGLDGKPLEVPADDIPF